MDDYVVMFTFKGEEIYVDLDDFPKVMCFTICFKIFIKFKIQYGDQFVDNDQIFNSMHKIFSHENSITLILKSVKY